MKSVQISLRSYRVLLKLSASLPSTTFSTGVYKVPIFQQQRPRVDHYASLSYIMMTWGKELPTVRIILEDGTLAKKGFLFSFRNYDGDEDNRLYLEAITDEAYLKFLTEGAFGLDVKSQFHGETHSELYLPLSVASASLVCYSRDDFEYTTRIKASRSLPEGYCCPFRPRYCHCHAFRRGQKKHKQRLLPAIA